MFNQINEKDLIQLIYSDVGTLVLDRKQTAKALGISTTTLSRMTKSGIGPKYKKVISASKSKNGAVKYPLHDLVHYIVNGNIKCA